MRALRKIVDGLGCRNRCRASSREVGSGDANASGAGNCGHHKCFLAACRQAGRSKRIGVQSLCRATATRRGVLCAMRHADTKGRYGCRSQINSADALDLGGANARR